MAEIPTSKLGRSSVVVKAVAHAGSKKLTAMAASMVRGQQHKERILAESDEEVAKTLFEALGQLKGTALKAAQMLHMELEFVPEAWRKELAKACYQAPSLNRSVVRRIFRSQFQQMPEQLFSQFEATPFAAASLGQVHKAADADGNELAVKIQYPGIADSIKSDLAMLSSLVKLLPSRYEVAHVMPEIETRLLEETDYRFEARQTAFFAETVALPGIRIPTVATSLSSERILATEWLAGDHLDAWLQSNPSRAARDRIADLFVQFFLYSLCQLGRIHADPNIGNYLITPAQELAVIDFGCTQAISPQTASGFMQLFFAYRAADVDTVVDLLYDFRIFDPARVDRQQALSLVTPFVHWVSPIFAEQGFDFDAYPDYLARGFDLTVRLHQQQRTPLTSNKDMVFFERTLLGYLRIFQQLGARVHFALDQYARMIPQSETIWTAAGNE